MKTNNNLFTVSSFIVTSILSAATVAAENTTDNVTNNTAAPVVVTATRFAASIDSAPVNVTTITAADIASSSAANLSDVLNYQAGVSVTDLFGISGASSKVDLGGFGENGGQNTLVLLNGHRLNDLDLDGVNLAGIPLESIAQVDIIHGSAAVLYGDNATGGVINIVTKNAFDGERAAVKIQNGSFQTQRLSADVRKLTGNTALSLALDNLKTNGYRDNNAYENASLAGELNQQQGNRNYGARVNLSREKTGLPGALDEATYKADPRAANSLDKAKETRNSIEGFFNNEHLASELTISKKHQDYVSTDFGLYESEADLTTVSLTPRVNRQYDGNNVVGGLDIYRSKFNAKYASTSIFGFDTGGTNAKQETYALYLTDSISLQKNTDLNLGARHQLIKVSSNAANSKRDDSITSWDITLSHKHRYGGRNYARIAKSFRMPAFDEMWNYTTGNFTLIKPQTGRHYEIGTRQTFASGLQLDANLFRMNLENEIAYDLAAGAFGENVNLSKTRHAGLNVNVRTAVSKQTSVQAGYAYRKATMQSGLYRGNDIPLVARSKLKLSGQHQLDKNRTLGLDAIYTGKRRLANDDNNVGKNLPAYTRIDANYTQQFNGWKGRIKLQNATNVKVADFGVYRSYGNSYYPLPERAIYFMFEGEL